MELTHDKSGNGVYWKKGDPVPFCGNCYEGEKKERHLVKEINTENSDPVMYECKACKNNFYIKRKDLNNYS